MSEPAQKQDQWEAKRESRELNADKTILASLLNMSEKEKAALVAENERLRVDYESSMEAIARTIEQALPALQCATCPKQLAHLPDGIRKMVQREAALAGRGK